MQLGSMPGLGRTTCGSACPLQPTGERLVQRKRRRSEKFYFNIFQQLNHANLLILSSWVAESLDKCVCPKQGTPKSSGLNCNFEGVDTIGMHTWSVYRQIVASSFDHVLRVLRFRSFQISERFRSRSHLATPCYLSLGLSTSILLLVGQIALVAESYAT